MHLEGLPGLELPPTERRWGGDPERVSFRALALAGLFPLCYLSGTFCDLPGWGSLMLRNEKGGVFADN